MSRTPSRGCFFRSALASRFQRAQHALSPQSKRLKRILWRRCVMNDLKFALRQLLKNPGFTAVAVLTLALGIGANTAIFSVVNAVLLRPLPYPEANRLVAVCESNPRLGLDQYVTSMGAYFDWREQNSIFEELGAATMLGPTPVFGKSGSVMAHVASVSANFFPLLGVQPILGRQFLAEEENPDSGNVVLLSEGLWRDRFGADPAIIGRDPLGKRIGSPDFGPQPCELVGVIKDVKHAALDTAPKPEVFRPLLQGCFSTLTIVARSRLAPTETFATVRAAVSDGDQSWPAYNPRTLDHLVSTSMALRL